MTSLSQRLITHIPDSPAVRTSGTSAPAASVAAASGTAASGPSVSSTRGRAQTHVQFVDDIQFADDEEKSGVLVACQTSHPGGVIAPLVRGLTDLKLEVHQIESKLSDGVRSERLWVSAPGGEPLSQRSQGLLRTAVFQALESVNEPSSDASELTA